MKHIPNIGEKVYSKEYGFGIVIEHDWDDFGRFLVHYDNDSKYMDRDEHIFNVEKTR